MGSQGLIRVSGFKGFCNGRVGVFWSFGVLGLQGSGLGGFEGFRVLGFRV